MSAEILICSKCGQEYDLQYKDDEAVSRSSCGCKRSVKLIDGMKPLDYFIKHYEEVLNEQIKSGTRKISIPIKARK